MRHHVCFPVLCWTYNSQPYRYLSLELFIRLQIIDQEFYIFWDETKILAAVGSTMKIINITTTSLSGQPAQHQTINQNTIKNKTHFYIFCSTSILWLRLWFNRFLPSQKLLRAKSSEHFLTSYSNEVLTSWGSGSQTAGNYDPSFNLVQIYVNAR